VEKYQLFQNAVIEYVSFCGKYENKLYSILHLMMCNMKSTTQKVAKKMRKKLLTLR